MIMMKQMVHPRQLRKYRIYINNPLLISLAMYARFEWKIDGETKLFYSFKKKLKETF